MSSYQRRLGFGVGDRLGRVAGSRRATLIGTRSFGKGSVPTVLPLGEDGALKLTTALYAPSGSIQAKGIDPDIRVLENIPDDLKGKVSSMGEASLAGHLKNAGEEEKGSDAYVPPDRAEDRHRRSPSSFCPRQSRDAEKSRSARGRRDLTMTSARWLSAVGLLAVALAAAPGLAQAQEGSGCGGFKWPLKPSAPH